MSEEKRYDSKMVDVHHTKDQSGRVNDEEKAHDMAKEEGRIREIANKYQEYLAADEAEFLKKNDNFSDFRLYDFRVMKKGGVPPEYVQRYAEVAGEVEGDFYDFRKDLLKRFDRDGKVDFFDMGLHNIFDDLSREIDRLKNTAPKEFRDAKHKIGAMGGLAGMWPTKETKIPDDVQQAGVRYALEPHFLNLYLRYQGLVQKYYLVGNVLVRAEKQEKERRRKSDSGE